MVADKATDRQEVRFKLIYQILITMLVVALVPLGGLWYISIHKSKQEWTTNISQNLVNNTEHLTRSVDEWTATNLRLLEQNSSTPAILGMQAAAQNPVLKSITDVYQWIYLAFTVLPDGQNLGRSDGKALTYYGDREYVKQVLGEGTRPAGAAWEDQQQAGIHPGQANQGRCRKAGGGDRHCHDPRGSFEKHHQDQDRGDRLRPPAR